MKNSREKSYPLIVIVGPTGSGKSELGIYLARRVGGAIISCDALQVYKGLDIGTAKVPLETRQSISHYMIDIVNPHEHFSAGDFMRLGRQTLAKIKAQNQVPLVVGGTGLYLRALLDGLFEEPPKRSQIRSRLVRIANKKGLAYLYRLLRRIDPSRAAAIKSNDRSRIIRALEVYFLSGRSLSEHFKTKHQKLSGFQTIKLGLNPPREFLYERLDKRVEVMFARGLITEVKRILEQGCPGNAKSLSGIGYRRVLSYLEGKISLNDAVELTKLDTRRYAKRQRTWFRKERGIFWLVGFGDDESVKEGSLKHVQQFMNPAA